MGFIKTNKGAELYLYRANTKNEDLSTDEYTPDKFFKISINETVPLKTNTKLNNVIPITYGTPIDDGTNQLTGSNGGNNTTSNTTVFKPGAGLLDNEAQNLIANTTSEIKQWHISTTTAINKQKHIGLWLFFNSAVIPTLQAFNCVEFRFGSDSSNYYSASFGVSILQPSWNWFDLGVVDELNETGTVGASVNYFSIIIRTNNSADVWDAGEVVYDLLRQWDDTDLIKQYVEGHPNIKLNNLEVIRQGYITSTDAVGFNINGYADFNNDTVKLMTSKSRFKSRSKSDNDELIFISKDRIII